MDISGNGCVGYDDLLKFFLETKSGKSSFFFLVIRLAKEL
jgi:hypothetical protein